MESNTAITPYHKGIGALNRFNTSNSLIECKEATKNYLQGLTPYDYHLFFSRVCATKQHPKFNLLKSTQMYQLVSIKMSFVACEIYLSNRSGLSEENCML